jgi:hypothetical protein
MDVIQRVIPGLEHFFQEVPQPQLLNSTDEKVEEKTDLESDSVPLNLESEPDSLLSSRSNLPGE